MKSTLWLPLAGFLIHASSLLAHAEAPPCSPDDLYQERVGFGAQATGGDPGHVYHVTTLADTGGPGSLRAATSSDEKFWIVFDVSGTIQLQKSLRIKSNKTLDGRHSDIAIVGEIRIDAGVQNVILTDLTISNPDPNGPAAGDAIGVRGHAGATFEAYDTRDLWFNHLNIFRSTDGLLDVRGGTNITVSWSHFHTHDKAMLVWDDTDTKPAPEMRLTLHHNYFQEITRRSPQVSYGKADFFNNFSYHWYEFAAASIQGAQLLSENNIYEARSGIACLWPCPDPNSPTHDSDFMVSKKAVVFEWSNPELGNVRSVGDRLDQGAKVQSRNPEAVFRRSDYYPANLEIADDSLRNRIVSGAEPRKSSCL